MTVRILHGDIHLIDLQTRLPFKYGIATMTRAPQAFVRLVIEAEGREATGIAADLLPPRWFTKNPDKPLAKEIGEMLHVIEHAVERSAGLKGSTVFEIWSELSAKQYEWGRTQNYPPLLAQFGTSLVERALVEAYCRAFHQPFADCLRQNRLGIRLEAFDRRLAGRSPADLLPRAPLARIQSRHTVGMADNLVSSEVGLAARLNDGLPQALDECIRHYGLTHFKLKLSGAAEADQERLVAIALVIEQNVAGDFAFTLDGNESFRSLEDFRDCWQRLAQSPALREFLTHMMFVEQPFHRDIALDAEQLRGLASWTGRPRLIIDESDAETDSLSRALALGYHGTSHKNCKGVFKGIANACLLEFLRRDQPASGLVMSGEDLANIGPIALLQDLAVVASLGVKSVERNGHHYFAGLSAFPESVQQQAIKHHPDLYEPSPAGWPTLRIHGGELALNSIIESPLGVGFPLDVEQFAPASRWKLQHLAPETSS